MAEIINLRQARKGKARENARAKGDENAAKFGLTKAERDLQKARAEKSARDLDQHLRTPPSGCAPPEPPSDDGTGSG